MEDPISGPSRGVWKVERPHARLDQAGPQYNVVSRGQGRIADEFVPEAVHCIPPADCVLGDYEPRAAVNDIRINDQ